MDNSNLTTEYLLGQFGLEEKVVLVTGGNSGLGLAIAKGLGKAGAKVAIVGRNEEKNTGAEGVLLEEGIEAMALKADVTKSGEIRQAVARTVDKFGALDILVNSAGITLAVPSHQVTESQWSNVLSTNLKGTLICCQEAYRLMKGTRDDPAKIINIASAFGFFGGSFVAAYAASKGGVVQLTRSLAVEWGTRHIRANAIVPGWFETPMTAPMRMVPDTARGIIRRTPLGRFGLPDEVAGTAVFLASKAANYITGASIWVDGGYSIAS